MTSADPNKHGRIHKALGSLSASMLAGLVTKFLQSVSKSGWAGAAAALDPVTAGAVLATTTIFGISHACEGEAERKKAGDLAKEFAKLRSQQGKALDLLNKIADGEIGIELNWFGVQEVAERTSAMISGELDEQFASVLESQQAGFATLGSRLAELNKKLDDVLGEQKIAEPPADLEVSTGRLPVTGEHLFGRDAMLKDLDDAWDDKKTNVFALVGGGGVGKSALVNHWLAAMGQDNYRGARRVYGHSFYSQGTSDGTASADPFFAEALPWFGDEPRTEDKRSAWAKGERLAELVRQERTLLILDGMEPLQFPPGPNAGRVTDPGLQALLRDLAARNPGLCVVTTREHVADLDNFADKTARQESLDVLSVAVGARLLKKLGVKGPLKERKEASKAFGNHALALTLLGKYLGTACDGDVRRHTEVSLLDADNVQGGHARRVMRSYEKWFTEHGREAELSIVRMLGLFNRPAEAGCIAALRGGEPIADLTAGLAGISDADWNIALANLREAGLLAKADDEAPGALGAHPLVREHFGERLENDYPEAWKAGHRRLYEYLKGPGCTKDQPDTAEEMAPLYAAILHGCAAGRHQEALDTVYVHRVQRGEKFHNLRKHGAFGADLGALVGLFEGSWRRPVASLSEAAQASVLNSAGFCLRALGRLTEAAEPMLAACEAVIKQEDWGNAGVDSCNLSELYLTLGRIRDAIEHARRGVDFADRRIHPFLRLSLRATLANALHQAGRVSEAQTRFQEAELMQKGWQPDASLLYSLRGYHYCDLLLALGDHQGVIERATSTIKIAKCNHWLIHIALDHISLGRAYLLTAPAEGTDAYKQAWAYIDLAVDGLREAGMMDHLPRGMLARAELYLSTGDLAGARAALNEAMDIATRDPAGPMKLFVTNCHLGHARLAVAEKKPGDAQDRLAKARALIDETGYHRRDAELAELEERVEGLSDPRA